MPRAEHKNARTSYLPPHGLRAAAWIIDFLVVTLVVMFGLPQPTRFVIPLALLIGYHTVTISRFHCSPGKAIVGLRVIRPGKRPTLLWALGRTALGYFCADLLGLGLLVALFDSRRRCAHDYVFGSFVIFEGLDAIKARKALVRFSAFLQRCQKTVEEKIVHFGFVAAPVVALFKAFRYFATKLNNGVEYLAGGSPAGAAPPAGILLSEKVAAMVLAASTAVSAGALAYFPSVRYYAGKLIAPHYILVKPPTDWVACGCPQQHQWYGAYYGLTLYHPSNIYCP
jgi:uncharacterized RDD family membrane protein YckC